MVNSPSYEKKRTISRSHSSKQNNARFNQVCFLMMYKTICGVHFRWIIWYKNHITKFILKSMSWRLKI